MKNNTYLIKIIILSFIVFTGCIFNDDDDCCNDNNKTVTGEGPLVTHVVNLPAFHNISNTGVMHLEVTKGSEQKVTIQAQDNIFEVLTFEVKNGTLTISTEDNVNVNTDKGLYGDLVITQSCESINLVGTGNITLHGEKQNTLNINVVGTGNVKAFDQEVDNCVINSTGTGNCEVWVNQNLSVTLTGIGSVYYKGNPSISQSIIGLGKIVDSN